MTEQEFRDQIAAGVDMAIAKSGIVEKLEAVRKCVEAFDAALAVLQRDPHQWSTRPCGTCTTVSALMGKPFGCDLYRSERAKT